MRPMPAPAIKMNRNHAVIPPRISTARRRLILAPSPCFDGIYLTRTRARRHVDQRPSHRGSGHSRSSEAERRVRLAREIDVQILRLARDLAHDVGGEPLGRCDRGIGVRELDLGEYELAVGELVDLPDERLLGDRVATLVDPATLGQRPHRVEDRGRRLLFDLGTRDARTELDGAVAVDVAVVPNAAEALGQVLARDVTLLDLLDLGGWRG